MSNANPSEWDIVSQCLREGVHAWMSQDMQATGIAVVKAGICEGLVAASVAKIATQYFEYGLEALLETRLELAAEFFAMSYVGHGATDGPEELMVASEAYLSLALRRVNHFMAEGCLHRAQQRAIVELDSQLSPAILHCRADLAGPEEASSYLEQALRLDPHPLARVNMLVDIARVTEHTADLGDAINQLYQAAMELQVLRPTSLAVAQINGWLLRGLRDLGLEAESEPASRALWGVLQGGFSVWRNTNDRMKGLSFVRESIRSGAPSEWVYDLGQGLGFIAKEALVRFEWEKAQANASAALLATISVLEDWDNPRFRALREESGDRSGSGDNPAILLSILATIAKHNEDFETSRTYFTEALAFQRHGGVDAIDEATYLRNLGSLECELKHFENAEQLLQRALTIAHRYDPDGNEEGAIYHNLSIVLLRRGGDRATAEGHAEMAIDRLNNPADQFASRVVIAYCRLLRGNIVETEALFNAAREFEDYYSGFADTLRTLAVTFEELDLIGWSKVLYLKLYQLQTGHLGDENGAIKTRLRLWHLALKSGNQREIRHWAQMIEQDGDTDESRERVALTSVDHAAAWEEKINQAAMLIGRGSFEDAERLLLLALTQDQPNHRYIAILHNLSAIASEQQDWNKFVHWVRWLLKHPDYASGTLKSAPWCIKLGKAMLELDDPEAATIYFRTALEVLERQSPTSVSVLEALRWLQQCEPNSLELNTRAASSYRTVLMATPHDRRLRLAIQYQEIPKMAARSLIHSGLPAEALRLLEECKAILLVANLDLSASHDPDVDALRSRLQSTEDALEALQRQSELSASESDEWVTLKREEANLLDRLLKAQIAADLPVLATAEEWRDALGEGTAYVSWAALGDSLLVGFVYEGNVCMWVMQLAEKSRGVNEDSVEDLLSDFLHLCDSGRSAPRVSWQHWAESAAEAYFPPEIRETLRSAKRVLLSPDARDWGLPLHLAWLDGDFLALQKPTSFVHSLSAYQRQQTICHLPADRSKALAVGINEFNQSTSSYADSVANSIGLDMNEPLESQMPPEDATYRAECVRLTRKLLDGKLEHAGLQIVVPSWERGKIRSILAWLEGAQASDSNFTAFVGEAQKAGRPRDERLCDLSEPVDEATIVAHFYGVAALVRTDARLDEVMARLPEAPVVHLSTHGIVDDIIPGHSGLFLQPVPKMQGLLTVESLRNIKLQARLVTLSACVTSLGQHGGAEGICGVAWGFLRSNARCVVSALESVGEVAAKQFMICLHARFASGDISMEAAILDTYREANAEGKAVHSWALFALYGDGTVCLYS